MQKASTTNSYRHVLALGIPGAGIFHGDDLMKVPEVIGAEDLREDSANGRTEALLGGRWDVLRSGLKAAKMKRCLCRASWQATTEERFAKLRR
jgi:hypothetical protein